MREIRLWDKRENRMIYAEEAKNSKSLLAIGLRGLPIAVDSDSFREGEIVGWNVDHRYVPMQFTGVKDSHGKDIYDGDIVKWDIEEPLSGICKVVWYEYGWFLESIHWHKEALYANLADGKGSTLEVIGNVYENPELIKKEH